MGLQSCLQGVSTHIDSVVIFQALQTYAATLTSETSAASLASTVSTAIFPQKHPGTVDLIITGTKMTHTDNFLYNESSKIQFFTEIWYLFLSEAVEASLCYFFENWLMKLKCPNLSNIQTPSLQPKCCF